jgi:hypothetical protein
MTKRLIARYNGLEEYQHIDPMKPDDLIIETVQDCTAVLEDAKQWRDVKPGKDWRHVACVPMYFVDKAAKEGWLHDDAKWHAFLNDPDNKFFRTWPGRIGPSGQF